MATVQEEPASSIQPTREPSLLPVLTTPTSMVPYPRPSGGPSRGKFQFALVASLLVLTVILGGVALLLTEIFSSTPQASIVIVPMGKSAGATITLLAVPGHASVQQVQARFITATVPAQTTTVPATGIVQQANRVAQGSITFLNIAPFAQYVAAGSKLTTRGGIQVETLAQAQIPAGNAPEQGSVIVAARAVDPGASGNIPAFALNNTQCCDNGTVNGVVAENTGSFSGGQDATSYTVVQQADITNATAPLLQQVALQEQPTLQAQVQANEALVAGSRCDPSVQSSAKVGERTSQLTVAVGATCSGEVYSHQDVERLAKTWLLGQPTTAPGIWRLTQVGPAHVTLQGTKGALTILTAVRGVWIARIDRIAIGHALQRIAGQLPSKARELLLQIPGIGQVQITGNFGNALPTDVSHIGYVIQGS